MSRTLVGCAVLTLLLATPSHADASTLLDWGTGCVSIGQLPVDSPVDSKGFYKRAGLGYRYSYFGIFGFDLWTWDGAYCIYNERGFKTIPDSEAQRIAKEFGIGLQPPFSYRVPSGLLVVTVVGVLGAPVALLRRRMLRNAKPSALNLSGSSAGPPDGQK